MNIFHRLFLRVMAGFYTRSRFHAYLEQTMQAIYRKETIDLFSQGFILRPDVQRYWQEYMPHRWHAMGYGGGRIDLGTCTRMQALQRIGEIVRGCEVKHVDDVMHFLFYKRSE
jgi:hypothetical protein